MAGKERKVKRMPVRVQGRTFTLNIIIGNKIKNKGGKLYAAFIDFKTTFDSVNRGVLLEKVERMGIKGKILEMLKGIYRETKNEVITGEVITDRDNGVRQGCPLSPSLFSIYRFQIYRFRGAMDKEKRGWNSDRMNKNILLKIRFLSILLLGINICI